ncbi:MAG: Uroporphyrinogen decarboxylase [Chlamydiae bacterium]|nr:Uroporphyrinogen decarboxylase [Chlamydiota bacterium]
MSLIDALHCKNQGRPPIWLMRQAGRYMPEYQALKKQHTLQEMFHTTELITQVTKLPIQLLDVDAAIIFADILTVLDGLGAEWNFEEGVGPVIHATNLQRKDPEKSYRYLTKAIQSLKQELSVPLIGFAGGPFTVATYLIEGKTSREFRKTKRLLFTDPEKFHQLLGTITDATIDYLTLQIEAGVDVIQLFDSWASILGIRELREFCFPYIQKIIHGIPNIPTIFFCRNSCLLASELSKLPVSALSLDWTGEINCFRPANMAVQGNLDPAVLYSSTQTIQAAAERLLKTMEGDPGYIFNLGHGIYPDTPFENVKFLVDYVKRSCKVS